MLVQILVKAFTSTLFLLRDTTCELKGLSKCFVRLEFCRISQINILSEVLTSS